MQEAQLTIVTTEAARIFEDRKRVRLLEPFIQEPRTLSDAAKKLGIKAPRLHYHVKRFLEHGLLEVAGATKRNGRTVKLYQATAKAFFVPFELTSSATLEQFLSDIFAAPSARLTRASVRGLEQLAPDWGFRWLHNGEGHLYFEMLPKTMNEEELESLIFAEETPAHLSFYVSYNLEHHTAKALQQELRSLAERYFDSQVPGAKSYLFRIGLAPLPNE